AGPLTEALVRADARDVRAAVRHRDGGEVDLLLRAVPYTDAEARPQGFVLMAGRPPEPGSLADMELADRAFAGSPVAMSMFDREAHYLRLNRTACRLMGVPEEELRWRAYEDSVPDDHTSRAFRQHLLQVARTGEPVCYESYTRAPASTREHAWNIWMWPIEAEPGTVSGVAIAVFDGSEQYWARQRLALLNEAGARLGTTLDITRTAQELTELVAPLLTDFVSVDLLDSVLRGREPAPGPVDEAVVLRRVAHASITAGTPEAAVPLGAIDVYPPESPVARALVHGRPVLSGPGQPDFQRWFELDPLRARRAREYGANSIMAVPLRARGSTLGVAVFIRYARQEPFTEDDALLAEELAGRAAVCVDNARRYTREHSTALALQRSLLPRELPGQAAVEVASRYLPTDSLAGVGGDWFDVIPLSSLRVALVVGDVVGHGIHASAAMGRLRTAVRTLADVDLPPDELLTHLDDMVTHLPPDEDPATELGEEAGVHGATCLYAVYDPVSHRCTVASAGHPPPVVLRPDGTTEVVALSTGPPLGIGALPFEATEVELPEGSLLALYTDGLVESRHRDMDAGVALLREALAVPAASLEAGCDTILRTVVAERPKDDAALLLARTRVLAPDRIAVWDVPADPAAVPEVRREAAARLVAWGLEDVAFVTELVVCELVTNAIRYGREPIHLRLIRDRTLLIVEVSDASNTAPHLRRAHTYDEGGRGLLLVAQFTQRWGTRQSTNGKTIWAEQALPAG
ncbi:MAG: SpoIIE family protein phosphatase, partial [Streptomycetaceae bacterium]|nr:SpoIIE family protein phosphatase [Streptomycetaceae bacterium]